MDANGEFLQLVSDLFGAASTAARDAHAASQETPKYLEGPSWITVVGFGIFSTGKVAIPALIHYFFTRIKGKRPDGRITYPALLDDTLDELIQAHKNHRLEKKQWCIEKRKLMKRVVRLERIIQQAGLVVE